MRDFSEQELVRREKRDKLVELGVMKKMPNKCVTKDGIYIKKKSAA